MPYIEITLDDKTDSQSVPNHYEIKRKSEVYKTNYLKVTHNIEYKQSYSYWRQGYFYLKFRKNYDKIFFFFYYVSEQSHVVQSLEVYLSRLHTTFPLIIGFKRKDTTRYFTYKELNETNTSYGFPSGGFEATKLAQKLQSENELRNKLKFNLERGQHQQYEITEDSKSYQGFTKYSYFAKDDISYDNHTMSKYKLFDKRELTDSTILDELLSNLKGRFYDFINVYVKSDIVLLVEFIDYSTKSYFRRKDKFGYYWIEDKNIKTTDNHDLVLKLLEIESEVNSTITYQLDKNKNDDKYIEKNIRIEEQQISEQEYFVYTQKPLGLSFIKNTYLLYNEKQIELVNNEYTSRSEDKLKTLNHQNITEISTYALETIIENHLLIKLTQNNDKVYYLQRFNKDGNKWRQVLLQNLKDAGVDLDRQTEVDKVLNDFAKTKLLLKYIRYEIYSIIVLLKMTSPYGHSEIEQNFASKGPEENVTHIIGGSNIVSVMDCTRDFADLSRHKYKSYSHKLKSSASAFDNGSGHKLYIRLYLGKHMIRLYNDEEATESTHLIYSSKKDKLYTYFYGTSQSPILFCHNDQTYKPKDKRSYNSKWIKVKSIKCACEYSRSGIQSQQLLKTLSDALGVLNVVYLSNKPTVGQDYAHNKLFKVYKINQLENMKPGSIDVYKNESTNKKFRLQADLEYENKSIDYFNLYFNRFENKTPLIVVLHFKETSRPNSRYFVWSEFKGSQNITKNISKLQPFKNEKDLLSTLNKESDQLEKFLTYDIGNITIGNVYNSNKIKVSLNHFISTLKSSGFKIHNHRPTNTYNENACVTYNNNPLYTRSGSSPKVIENIPNKIQDVTVYYSDSKVSDPLLIEIRQDLQNSNNLYFYHTKHSDGSLYWTEVKRDNTFLGIKFGSYPSIFQQLTETNYKKLELLLKKIEYFLTKSLVFIINRNIGTYSKSDVTSIFNIHNNYRIINTSINVNDKSESIFSCLTGKGFKIIEHDFSNSISDIKSNDDVEMIFIISNGTNSHNLIKLFDSDDRPIGNLKYSKSDKLYIYFYGTNGYDFSTPLLLYYNGNAFRPTNMDNYKSHKWTKVEINNSGMCDSSSNDQLLDVLSHVVGFLNVVQLDKRPQISGLTPKEPNQIGLEDHKYEAHEYNKQKIQIRVSYENKVCYRSYVHQPYGINGEGSNFRLGNITYKGKQYISYDLKKELTKVSMYYSVYDTEHKYPLLVKLDFKGGPSESEYYRLDDKVDLKWEKLLIDRYKDLIEKLSKDDNLESGLYDIRTKIDIKYSDDEKKNFFFNPEKCKEDKIILCINNHLPSSSLIKNTVIVHSHKPEHRAEMVTCCAHVGYIPTTNAVLNINHTHTIPPTLAHYATDPILIMLSII